MNRGTLITIAIILAVTAAIAVFLFVNRNISYSPADSLPECKTLSYNGESATNIVFFSDAETVALYKDELLSLSPFKENANAFNFYYIDEYEPSCELYKDVALFCYSRELVKKASSCPADYIIVAQDASTTIRSSAYMNVISLNSRLPKTVFMHEFGHAFANLADEYTPSSMARGSSNCAPDCTAFNSGCFEGCSKENYYRSINLGVMRTLSSSTFGKFNEEIIRQEISKQAQTITAMAVNEGTNCENNEYYLIEGSYSSNSLEIKSKSIERGCPGSNGRGPFNYTITLQDSSALYLGDFNAELIFTDSQTNEEQIGGGALANEGNFFLKIPLIENAETLEINADSLHAEISIKRKGDRPCEIV